MFINERDKNTRNNIRVKPLLSKGNHGSSILISRFSKRILIVNVTADIAGMGSLRNINLTLNCDGRTSWGLNSFDTQCHQIACPKLNIHFGSYSRGVF